MDPAKDTRNLVDKYKGLSVESIKESLGEQRVDLEIALENLTRDYNMGTIVRTANAFNVNKIHIIGSRQWNKRGAMKTDAYMDIEYHSTVAGFRETIKAKGGKILAVDIVEGALPIHSVELPGNSVLVFGSEGPGLSGEMLSAADEIVFIEQFGSTRSINVGVAAGMAMYEWVRQNVYKNTATK